MNRKNFTGHMAMLVFVAFLSAESIAQNMHISACQGKLARLDSLMGDTTDINIQDRHGRSFLHYAVGCDKWEVFEYLLNKDIDINIQDSLGRTALALAIRFNFPRYIDTLLLLHDFADFDGELGASMLETAILDKKKRLVEQLLKRNVEVNLPNDRGSTPLEIAMRMGLEDIAELLVGAGADRSKVRTFQVSGAYMGMKDPGKTPKEFAPNFISTEEFEFGSVFNKDATEFYYAVNKRGKSEIRFSRLQDGDWTKPVVILPHSKYGYNDPFLSPDENRLYYISKRAFDESGELKDFDIWYSEKVDGGWSQPINAGPNINTEVNEYYISFTKGGTMYFASNKNAAEDNEEDYDIYYSAFVNGEFQEAVNAGDSINTTAYEADVFIDPDEKYIIFCGTREEGYGRGDLYISFKNDDGSWTKSINMGEPINTPGHELCPFVTMDGKYLLYTSGGDIYWVSTEIFADLR